MKDATIYYNLRDFHVLRICCHHGDCRAVTELPPANVEAAMKKTNGCCPVCGKPFSKPDVEGGADVVTLFARTVLALSQLGGHVSIEFPVKEIAPRNDGGAF